MLKNIILVLNFLVSLIGLFLAIFTKNNMVLLYFLYGLYIISSLISLILGFKQNKIDEDLESKTAYFEIIKPIK